MGRTSILLLLQRRIAKFLVKEWNNGMKLEMEMDMDLDMGMEWNGNGTGTGNGMEREWNVNGNGMEWNGVDEVDEVDEVEGWIPPKNKYLTDQVESSCGTASGLAVDHEVSGVPAL